MLSSITIDDHTGTPVTLHSVAATSKRAAIGATGLIGGVVSAPRADKSTLPQAHGAINNTRYTDGNTISLTLEVTGVTVEDALSEFRLMAAPLLQTLDYGPALLKWTEGTTGLTLQRYVKLDGPIDPPIQGGASLMTFQVSLFSEDPRAYSQSQTTATASAMAAGVANSTFSGDAIGAAPANWTNSGWATFSVQSVVEGGLSEHALELASSGVGSGTATSAKVTGLSAGVAYTASVEIINAVVVGILQIYVDFYNSGGTLLGSTVAVPGTSQITGVAGQTWNTVLTATGTAPANTTQATVRIASALTATSTIYVPRVALSAQPTVTVVNNGTRDTPGVITLTGAYGQVKLTPQSGSTPTVDMTGAQFDTSNGTSVVDLSQRSITLTVGKALLNGATIITVPASIIGAVQAANMVWANFPLGTTVLNIVGLFAGATVSVATRDAY